MRAVILAAGDGGRLGHHTASVPKPLVEVSGKPLIAYTLDSLAEAGVREAVVVIGYRGDQLRAGLETAVPSPVQLSYVENLRFASGASLSLRAARSAVEGQPFLLLMADHLLSAPIIHALRSVSSDSPSSLIATDAGPWSNDYIDEATRVRLEPASRVVAAIGKHITPWDALDTGAFLLQPEAWSAVDAAPEDCELSVIFTELARRRQLASVDVTGAPWYDVDTAADLAAATALTAAGGAR